MTTMLGIVQEFCTRRGLPVPSIVMTSQDDQFLQLKALLHQVLEDLGTRKVWQKVTKEATFVTVDGEDQGSLDTIAPGMKWIVNNTFWNRTRRLPVYGPRNAQEWAALKGSPMTGPFMQYRLRGGNLLLNGGFSAGESLAFEYASDYLIQSSGGTYKQYFSQDDDKALIADAVLLAGLTWMWKEAKGFKYAEDFRRYESLVADMAGHDSPKPTVSMDGGTGQFAPGVMIPTGNWKLP